MGCQLPKYSALSFIVSSALSILRRDFQEMAVNSETEINLKTLQRVDSNIVEIIDNASQVAIYKYERDKWVSFLFVSFYYKLVV